MAANDNRLTMSRLIIEADHAKRAYGSDLWRYRELFFFRSWRDVLVRDGR
jgi:lipopolysaccharide transport system permease protein